MKRFFLQPMDYALFRDARPFSPDELSHARSVGIVPLPRTVYGALRTLLLNAYKINYQDFADGKSPANSKLAEILGTPDKAGTLAIRGPILCLRKREDSSNESYPLLLPGPADTIKILVKEPSGHADKDGRLLPRERTSRPPGPESRSRHADKDGRLLPPQSDRGLDNLPHENLHPLAASEYEQGWVLYKRTGKIGYEPEGRVLRQSDLQHYLVSREAQTWLSAELIPKEPHIGIERNPDTFRPKEGMLYGAEFLRPAFDRPLPWDDRARAELGYAVEVLEGDEFFPERAVFSVGGERRPFRFEALAADSSLDQDRAAVEEHLKGECTSPADGGKTVCRFRLYLIAPARFANKDRTEGWIPSFLDPGSLAQSENGVHYKLVAAAVPRSFPSSGWNLVKREPRESWRLVPAGSVYFLEAEASNRPAELAQKVMERFWLQSICGDEEDRKMGYGTVLVGGFNYVGD